MFPHDGCEFAANRAGSAASGRWCGVGGKIRRGFAPSNAEQEKEPFEKEGWAVERYIIWKGRAADLYMTLEDFDSRVSALIRGQIPFRV